MARDPALPGRRVAATDIAVHPMPTPFFQRAGTRRLGRTVPRRRSVSAETTRTPRLRTSRNGETGTVALRVAASHQGHSCDEITPASSCPTSAELGIEVDHVTVYRWVAVRPRVRGGGSASTARHRGSLACR